MPLQRPSERRIFLVGRVGSGRAELILDPTYCRAEIARRFDLCSQRNRRGAGGRVLMTEVGGSGLKVRASVVTLGALKLVRQLTQGIG